jgi:hypothetical protein
VNVSDPFDRRLSIEEQRAGMADLLQHADMAILITVRGTDVNTRFMNMNDIELMGLTQLLMRHVDKLTDRSETV